MSITAPDLLEHVCDLLRRGVVEVFETMLSLEVDSGSEQHLVAGGEGVVAASIGFIGDVNGVVYLHVTASFARVMASRMLSIDETQLQGDEIVNDAIGELSNMIVGAVKSRLCDSGAPCVLTIPSIVRGQSFSIEPVSSSERRVLSFRCREQSILVELLMKQP